MFKSMGYSPGFLLKFGQFGNLANSPEIHTNNLESSCKSICKHGGGVSGSLERFPGLTQIRHVQNEWDIAVAFCSKSADLGPFRIYPKSLPAIHKVVGIIHSQAHRRCFGSLEALFPALTRIRHAFYSPGFLLRVGQFRILENSL